MTAPLLIATLNTGKQREFRRLLGRLPAQLLTPDEIGLELEVDEPHFSYAENASAKAFAFANASGLLSVADDSGIEVAALDWGPGVRSARWGSGSAATQADELVAAIRGAADRRARMVCALALGIPSGTGTSVEIFTGVMEGSVADERRGSGGFGYDPIFLVDGRTTAAELREGEKDRISHRGRAVEAATPRLIELLSRGSPSVPRSR